MITTISPCYNFSCSEKNTANLKEFVATTARATGSELTQYLWKQRRLQVLISKKDSTLENTRSLQVASLNNSATTQMYGACAALKLQYNLNRNICQNIVYAQIVAASAVLK